MTRAGIPFLEGSDLLLVRDSQEGGATITLERDDWGGSRDFRSYGPESIYIQGRLMPGRYSPLLAILWHRFCANGEPQRGAGLLKCSRARVEHSMTRMHDGAWLIVISLKLNGA